MRIQKSFDGTGIGGILYLVSTPIGNLEDMTFRAIRLLKEADVIAAEDTRNTKKLCNYFDITTPLISYHEHNKETSGKQLVERLKGGETVALVSDAGMPCISDPGYELASLAIEEGIKVVPIPGANAALTALIASGIKAQPFYFYGFLPRGKKEKAAELEAIFKLNTTAILYEAPHRLKETLKAIAGIYGGKTVVLCRELTKKYEEFIRGTAEDALEWAGSEEVRGEFCIILEAGGVTIQEQAVAEWWENLTVEEHVNHYINEGKVTAKEGIKQAALDRGMKKRDVYQIYHVED